MADSSAFTPFSQVAGGFESGLKVAQAAEKLQEDKALAQQNSQAHEAKKFTWLSNQLGAALAADPAVRRVQLKRLQAQSGAIGIPWDPANNELLMNDEYARHAQQGLLKLNGLPDDQKSQAASSIFGMTGDVGALTAGINQIGQLYSQNAARQAAAQAGGVTSPQALTQYLDVKSKIFQEHKTDIEAVKAATKAQDLLKVPGSQIDQQTADVLLAKLQDPGSIARESEVRGVDKAAAQGIMNSLAQTVRKWSGGEPLSAADRGRLLDVIDTLAGPHANAIAETKAGVTPYLHAAGHDPTRVFAGIPEYKPIGRRATGGLAGNAGDPGQYVNDATKKQWAMLSPQERAQFAQQYPQVAAAFTAGGGAAQVAGVSAPKDGE